LTTLGYGQQRLVTTPDHIWLHWKSA